MTCEYACGQSGTTESIKGLHRGPAHREMRAYETAWLVWGQTRSASSADFSHEHQQNSHSDQTLVYEQIRRRRRVTRLSVIRGGIISFPTAVTQPRL